MKSQSEQFEFRLKEMRKHETLAASIEREGTQLGTVVRGARAFDAHAGTRGETNCVIILLRAGLLVGALLELRQRH